MSKNLTSNALTQAALMAAVSVVLSIAGYFLPFGLVFLLVAGVPLSVLCVKQNANITIFAAIVGAILLGIFFGPLYFISYIVQVAPIGIVVGYLLAKKSKAATVIVAGIVVAVAGTLLLVVLSSLISGVQFSTIGQSMASMQDEMLKMSEEMGMFDAMQAQGYSKDDVILMLNQTMSLMLKILPAILTLGAMLKAVAHYVACVYILRRLNVKVRKLPKFERWQLNSKNIFVIIALWIVMLLDKFLPNFIIIIAQNVLVVYAAMLMVIGLSVMAHKFKLRKASTATKVMVAIFIIFGVLMGYILFFAVVGLFDMLLDFRKLAQEKEMARLKYEAKKAQQNLDDGAENTQEDEDNFKEE